MNNIVEYLNHIATYDKLVALKELKTGNQITYTELLKSIYQTSSVLKNHIKSGDRVIIHGLTDVNWVITFFGVLLAGGIAVPVDTRMSDNLLNDVLILTQPSLIIASDTSLFQPSDTYSILPYSKLVTTESLQKYISDRVYDPLLPCQIIFTSGTWSKPKGVTLSFRNILSNMSEITDNIFQVPRQTRFLSILPLSHAFEQMCGLLLPLYFGSTIGYLNQITPLSLKSSLKSFQPHYIVAVPKILELLKRSIDQKISPKTQNTLFYSLIKVASIFPFIIRRVLFAKIHQEFGNNLIGFFIGGAPVKNDVDRFFQAIGIKNFIGYGMSEASPLITASIKQKRISNEVGKPLNNLEFQISSGGEIQLRGPSIFMGYWPDIDRNPHDYFQTGDLGHVLKNGSLILQGRLKNLIVYPSGDKIFYEDIENLIEGISVIKQACIVQITDNPQQVYVVIILQETEVQIEDLPKAIRNVLPSFVYIKGILYFPATELPRTHTLKHDRKAIQLWVQKNKKSDFM